MEWVLYLCYAVGVFLATMGLYMLSGRGKWLLAGYNTSDPKEQERLEREYDIVLMVRLVGLMLLLISIALVVMISGLIGTTLGIIFLLSSIYIPLMVIVIGHFTFLKRK